MVMYLVIIVRHYHILNKHDITQNPTDYLDSLKEYQKTAQSYRLVLLHLYIAFKRRAGPLFCRSTGKCPGCILKCYLWFNICVVYVHYVLH
jgi:hypothetical protein